MSDANKSDHWGVLASKLGAESSSEPAQTEPEPTPDPPPPPPAEPPKATETKRMQRTRPRPKPAAADWSALASELGVVPAPQPEAPTQAKESASESPGSPAITEKPVREGFGDSAATKEEVTPPAEPTEFPTGSGLSMPAEESVEVTETKAERKPAQRRRKRRRTFADDDQSPRDAEPEADETEPSGKVSETVEEAPGSEADDGEQEKPKKAKRRRRRGSSRRKKSDSQPDADAAQDDSEPPRPADESPATESEETLQPQSDKEEPAKGAKTAKGSHRGIPTWEEAIGLIVSANLESRSRRPSGGSSRGRGKPRSPKKTQDTDSRRGSKEAQASKKKSSSGQ